MKRVHGSRILALLLVLAMMVSILPAAFAAQEDEKVYTFAIISTTDMHGRATSYDVSTQKEDPNSMPRVATIVKEVEEMLGKENVLLVDNGDLLQGTLVSQYAVNKAPTEEHPMVTAIKEIGYDAWVMGNHEFNFSPAVRDTQVAFAAEAGIAPLAANLVLKEDGKNYKGEDVKAGEPYYEPYKIVTLGEEGHQVRVAVIGMANAANATWDIPANYPNLQFSSLDNPSGSLAFEINKWTQKIKDEKLADVIIVSAHSGRGSDDRPDHASLEAQAESCVPETTDMDLLIFGHDHTAYQGKVANKNGKMIPIVNGGGTASTGDLLEVTFNEDGTVKSYKIIDTPMHLLKEDDEGVQVVPDYDLAAKTQPWYDRALEWASAPLGKFEGGWNELTAQTEGKTNDDMCMQQTALLDFVHKGQIWSTWQNYESDGIEGATVSIASPVFGKDKQNGSVLTIVPKDGDAISTLELSKLYRYSNNLMCSVDMTGQQLYNWMSKVADMYAVDEEGNPCFAEGTSIYGVDTFYGVDYEFDLTKPAGQRVAMAKYNGEDLLKHEGKIRVALNSYRIAGGYGFKEATGLTAADCPWTADRYLGSDRSPVPTQLGEYVAAMKTIKPDDKVSHGTDSKWSLKTGDSYTFAILSTTDMHGRATLNDVATQKEDPNSMIRVSTVVKEQEEKYGKENVILVDNGDLLQGTLVSQYAVNLAPTEENPMVTALKDIGYDVWVMGNHEFNFNPTIRNTQIKFAEEGGIAPLAANLVLKEDGKNYKGEDTKAGEPFYEPYKIITVGEEGHQVRVAVIGMANAANATWDIPANYPNLQFSSLDNPDGKLDFEINKWAKKIKNENLADIIVVSAHSGRGSDDRPDYVSLESQAAICVPGTTDMDLLIFGHDHTAFAGEKANKDGRIIPMANGGGTDVTKNEITVTFKKDGSIKAFQIGGSELLPLKDAAPDTALAEKNQTWYDRTLEWASAPLGKFEGGWNELTAQTQGRTNEDMVLQQTALLDLVHKGQIWSTWQNYESDGIEGATVSIASPVFGKDKQNGSVLTIVPKDGDAISTLELSKLYRYSNNLMCSVDMTGQQLYNWMSAVADMYAIDAEGNPCLGEGTSIYGVDTFYGVDYEFDLTKPAGYRVAKAEYNGENLLEYEGKIRVALNSYRIAGGYGFKDATGLTAADCPWTADRYLGSDRSPVPTQLGEYVAAMKVIKPDDKVSHGNDSRWSLITTHAYADVTENDWFAPYVNACYDRGLMFGVNDTDFDPQGHATRAQMATIVARLVRQYDVTYEDTVEGFPFKDVPESAWYYKDVVMCYKYGIINGVAEELFDPEGFVTRDQAVAMLYRAFKHVLPADGEDIDLSQFPDGNQVENYAKEAMDWALKLKLVQGSGKDGKLYLNPQNEITRAEMAAILVRLTGSTK